MSSNPHDAFPIAGSGAHLTGLEEEVDPASRPAGAPGAVGEAPHPTVVKLVVNMLGLT